VVLIGTHQIVVYTDDVNMLGKNTNTIKKNTEGLSEAGIDVGPEVNTEKTNYMVVSCHQIAGQNYNLLIGIKFFENVICSNVWDQQCKIKIAFMKKLRAE
jgi:hypothetical protein